MQAARTTHLPGVRNSHECAETPSLLVCVPVKNCARSLPRTLEELAIQDYAHDRTDVVLMENDSEDDSWAVCLAARDRLSEVGFRNVVVERARFGFRLPHHDRHTMAVQARRYLVMGQVRQTMLERYLADQDFLWWLDADIIGIPVGALSMMIGFDVDALTNRFVVADVEFDHTTQIIDDDGAVRLPRELLGTDRMSRPLLPCRQTVGMTLFRRSVLEEVNYRGMENDIGQQEGAYISRQAYERGFGLYWSPRVIMEHANV